MAVFAGSAKDTARIRRRCSVVVSTVPHRRNRRVEQYTNIHAFSHSTLRYKSCDSSPWYIPRHREDSSSGASVSAVCVRQGRSGKGGAKGRRVAEVVCRRCKLVGTHARGVGLTEKRDAVCVPLCTVEGPVRAPPVRALLAGPRPRLSG